MPFRKKVIAANWKMNKTTAEAAQFVSDFKIELGDETHADVVLVPAFVALKTVSDLLTGTGIKLGAQNIFWEKSGAFTGEISAEMLREVFVRYVVIGHSERRQYFGETNATVNKRVKAALAAHFRPILCIGETLAEREAGKVEEIVVSQFREGLAGISEAEIPDEIIIAYEPVWAIGTGKTATPAQAQEVHALIRRTAAGVFGEKFAEKLRIQYGGSVKGANSRELMGQPDIDGALVGGASLDPREFALIVKNSV
ncbi:MAG: triose-phosphate isomerase [Verrucomicrobiae bacterium]|nr:triose-phosphate isomerase [Verrucomicrobiae bacterium]